MESKITQKPETPESIMDTLRLKSIATGTLFDVQVLNLKCIPLVIFGENLSNEFKIDFDKRTIEFTLTGVADYPVAETKARLDYLVQSVRKIIGNFEISVVLNKKALDGRVKTSTAGKARKKLKPGGKKRLRKVRKGK